MDTNSNAVGLFSKSIQLFKASLSEDQRKAFVEYMEADVMWKELEKFCESRKNASKLLACCAKIRTFSDSFAPYFDVVGIFVQVKPEWFGVLWGSLRFVFQLGSNFVTLFEKISDMLETLSSSLPQFQRHFDALHRRTGNQHMPRAVTLLAYLYADILQLVQEIIEMLSRGRNEPNKLIRATILARSIWKPITTRFKEAEARMARHEELLLREFQVIGEENLTDHLENVNLFIKSMRDGETTEAELIKKMQQQEDRRIASEIKKVEAWVGLTDYLQIYERARRAKQVGTGVWFLGRGDYVSLRDGAYRPSSCTGLNQQQRCSTSWKERLMIVQAKPGYGKTVLSTTIIEDIEATVKGPKGSNVAQKSVCFYHFSNLDESTRSHAAAFRALTLQLIKKHRTDQITIDALSLFRAEKARNQVKASEDDLEEVLQILLLQFPTFIVVDGVEEAYKSSQFLERLLSIMKDLDAKAIILTRPTVRIPAVWTGRSSDTSCCVTLGADDNRDDFQLYFKRELGRMVAEQLFGQWHHISDHIPNVAKRANGMFLWAELLIRYLNCEALTPQRRVYALENANMLEGLDGLYSGILTVLTEEYVDSQTVAANIFRWVSCSIYPLSSATLKIAIAINAGQPTDESQYLCNWPSSIYKITGGLVELYAGRPIFIHTSFQEFLESEKSHRFPRFSLINKGPVHAYLATQCLSYLAHDVPKRPLQPVKEIDESQTQEETHPYRMRPRTDLESLSGLSSDCSNLGAGIRAPPSTPSVHSRDVAVLINRQFHHELGNVGSFAPPLVKQPLNSSAKTENTPQGPPDDLPSFTWHGSENVSQPVIGTWINTDQQGSAAYTYGSALGPHLTTTNMQAQYFYHQSAVPNKRPRQPSAFLQDESNWRYYNRKRARPAIRTMQSQYSTGVNNQGFNSDPVAFSGDLHKSQSNNQKYSSEQGISRRFEQQLETGDTSQDLHNFSRELPFLSYAALTSLEHIQRSIEGQMRYDTILGMAYVQEPSKLESRRILAFRIHQVASWIPVLSQFLVQESVRTVWVEACYSFKLSPNVFKLLPTLKLLRDHAGLGSVEEREIWWITHGLNQLSEGLKQLQNNHKDVLTKNPSQIWTKSIKQASDPNYWPVWEYADPKLNQDGAEGFHETREPFEGGRFNPLSTPPGTSNENNNRVFRRKEYSMA